MSIFFVKKVNIRQCNMLKVLIFGVAANPRYQNQNYGDDYFLRRLELAGSSL